jgi:hypothetical protein
MILQFSNARVEIARQGDLAQLTTLSHAGRKLQVLGKPSWLVDFDQLGYSRNRPEIEAALEEAVCGYLDRPESWYRLARLSGRFLVLVSRGEELQELITSDQLPNTLYYYQEHGRLVLSDDVWACLPRLRPLSPEAYSEANLAYFDQKKTCIPDETLFKGLFRLRPATIYRVQEAGLHPQRAVYYVKQDPGRFRFEDFLAVIGRQLEPGRYTLAYSTGIDSHHLLQTFGDWIEDLCTVYYAAPHQEPERSKEAGVAVINALEADKPFQLVPADFADRSNLAYLRDGVRRDPFACHFTFSMYQLFRRARTDRILTGQNADTVQFFGLTSPIPWRRLLGRSPLRNYDYTYQQVYYRWCVLRSFGRVVNPELLDRRLFYHQYHKVRGLVGPHGYWPLMYFKMINNMTSGNTAIFRNAAAYFNKRVFFPYLEPLALFVSCYQARPWWSVLDPKRNLRRLHRYLRPSQVPWQPKAGRPYPEGPLFREVALRAQAVAPQLKQWLDTRVKNPMPRLFLYQTICLLHETLPAARP